MRESANRYVHLGHTEVSKALNSEVRVVGARKGRKLGSARRELPLHALGSREPDMEMSVVAAFARTRMARSPRSGERSYG